MKNLDILFTKQVSERLIKAAEANPEAEALRNRLARLRDQRLRMKDAQHREMDQMDRQIENIQLQLDRITNSNI